MKELSRFVGEMEYDGLISGLNTPAVVGGGILSAAAEGTAEYKRGTVLAKSAVSGQLHILGSMVEGDTLTPDCILCDDTVIANTPTTATVYLAGCFNPDKLTLAVGYTLTEADKDKLRERGILLKAVAN